MRQAWRLRAVLAYGVGCCLLGVLVSPVTRAAAADTSQGQGPAATVPGSGAGKAGGAGNAGGTGNAGGGGTASGGANAGGGPNAGGAGNAGGGANAGSTPTTADPAPPTTANAGGPPSAGPANGGGPPSTNAASGGAPSATRPANAGGNAPANAGGNAVAVPDPVVDGPGPVVLTSDPTRPSTPATTRPDPADPPDPTRPPTPATTRPIDPETTRPPLTSTSTRPEGACGPKLEAAMGELESLRYQIDALEKARAENAAIGRTVLAGFLDAEVASLRQASDRQSATIRTLRGSCPDAPRVSVPRPLVSTPPVSCSAIRGELARLRTDIEALSRSVAHDLASAAAARAKGQTTLAERQMRSVRTAQLRLDDYQRAAAAFEGLCPTPTTRPARSSTPAPPTTRAAIRVSTTSAARPPAGNRR